MRTINRSRVSNYELVYSTSRNDGSRHGNAGNRPARNNGGSRGADSEGAGYGSLSNGYFGSQRPGAFAPVKPLKEKEDLRKRGEDTRKSGDDKGGESN